MNKIYKLVKSNVITILIVGISLFAIYHLYNFIFWEYPNFIRSVFHKSSHPLEDESISYNIGTFGDMYGVLNAFLSGLAFIGALIAIILQVYQIDQERRKSKEEIKVQLNLFKWHLEKIKNEYLVNLKLFLEWDGNVFNMRVNSIDFNDDYSFKELLRINLNDLYKGFIAIEKFEQANKLIEFIQKLKQISEYYTGAKHFRANNQSKIRNAEIDVETNAKFLRSDLRRAGMNDVAELLGKNYQGNILSFEEDLDLETTKLLAQLPSYKSYWDALDAYDTEVNYPNIETEKRLTKINDLEILIDNISSNIPSL